MEQNKLNSVLLDGIFTVINGKPYIKAPLVLVQVDFDVRFISPKASDIKKHEGKRVHAVGELHNFGSNVGLVLQHIQYLEV